MFIPVIIVKEKLLKGLLSFMHSLLLQGLNKIFDVRYLWN